MRPNPLIASLTAMARLAEVLVNEFDHARLCLGAGRRVALAREARACRLVELQLDRAAGLAVGGHEAIQVRARMRDVLGGLEIEHRRHLDLLAALERPDRGAFLPPGFRHP